MNNFFRKFRYIAEAIIVKFGLWFFYFLGLKNASNLASFLARQIGKIHYSHKLALKNMSAAMPNFSAQEKEKILDDMWDNLGRVIGEFPHVAHMSAKELVENYVSCNEETKDNIEFIVKNYPQGGIIFSGHIANWEIGPKALEYYGFKVGTVYRPLNNPYVEDMTAKMRGVKMIAKSAQGNRQIIETVKNGEFVLIMADQKISEGENVQFFHAPAVTTTSIARMALKYNLPLIPARAIRLGRQFKFVAEVKRPLAFQKTDDLNKDVLLLTRQINFQLERWISEYPAQWFWVHNRWKQ